MSRRLLLVAALAGASACSAQQPGTSPHYPPSSLKPNVIRSWGDEALAPLMQVWEAAYRKQHPDITFVDELRGTATSMAGIITNTSDLSLMGRPVTVNEVIGFEWVYRAKPLGIQVANGNLKGEGASPALAVLVSRKNPLQQISMEQLAAVLGCPAQGATAPTWAMAGARGPWAAKPIDAYLYDDQTGTGVFLQQAVQGAKDCWNWDIVREFKDAKGVPASRQIAEALQHDPYGLAVTSIDHASATTKALPVSAGGGAPVAATPRTVIEGSYPLRRGVYIYLTRLPGKPVDPKVAAFLRFILSDEGQALVQRQGDFLPLTSTAAGEQTKKLE